MTDSEAPSLIVRLLGTGSPMPDAEHYLVDTGRGVLMRLAACGLGPQSLTAVLLTHLHSDHITDLNDVITSRWVMTFEETPLIVVGPPGTQHVVDHLLASLEPDIGYRMAHHEDLDHRPPVTVIEVEEGSVDLPDGVGGAATVTCAQTDHKPVEPSVGYRIEHGGAAVVAAGDTVPCVGLDGLCAGADALVHTVIRKDIIANLPIPRMQDTLDYHSSPEEAAQTAAKADMPTLILTHYVPAMPMSGTEDDWRALAAEHFQGTIELGDDLHRVDIVARTKG